jgi:N-acetylmuramoyl-L-alanine amidase
LSAGLLVWLSLLGIEAAAQAPLVVIDQRSLQGREVAVVPGVEGRWYDFLELCAALGVEGTFDPLTLIASMRRGDRELRLMPGVPWAVLETRLVPLGVAPRQSTGRLQVPEAFLSTAVGELFGGQVRWNRGEHELLIRSAGSGGVSGASAREFVVVVDAGHGGADRGIVPASGADEAATALRYARRLSTELARRVGVRVVLTREVDGAGMSLDERVAVVWNVDADLVLGLHCHGEGGAEEPRLHIFRPPISPFVARIDRRTEGRGTPVQPWGARRRGAEEDAEQLARELAARWGRAFAGAPVKLYRAPLALLEALPSPGVLFELPLGLDEARVAAVSEVVADAMTAYLEQRVGR